MQPKNSPVPKVKFAALYFVSLVLLIIILSAFWGPLPSLPKKIKEANLTDSQLEEHQVLLAIDLIHRQSNQLQHVVRLQESLPGVENLARVNTIINALRSTIDSIELNTASYSKDIKIILMNAIEPLKLALDNLSSFGNVLRRTNKDIHQKDSIIATLEKQLKGKVQSPVNVRERAILNNDLQMKKGRINDLEAQLKNLTVKGGKSNARTEDIEKLISDNKYYQLSLRSQVQQTNKLLEMNKSLKSNIDNLNKRLEKLTNH